MIVLISVSDFTELLIAKISIEHNIHADLSILALSQALHGVQLTRYLHACRCQERVYTTEDQQ